ncbi:hypothetical protein ILUMI_24009 [Ignelater luminosus]|uniref:Uncharacterized protein n=1 Tax=Ignelater luminosus TaxID=2038154 RepID=A0A8K0CCS4_IGNLU|nr:hypothetical protein ILUMI_24009 [Ignelater luminosus]
MVARFFSKTGHIATVVLEDRRTVNADWYTTGAKHSELITLCYTKESLLIEKLQTCAEWRYPLDFYSFRLIVKTVNRFKNNLPSPAFASSFMYRRNDKLAVRFNQNIKRSRVAVAPQEEETLCLDNSSLLGNNVRFVFFLLLPENFTHLTQPHDIAFFRPSKIASRKIFFKWKAFFQLLHEIEVNSATNIKFLQSRDCAIG